ncbi:MAG: glycerol kinase 5 [Promethearchaeota archaeon]
MSYVLSLDIGTTNIKGLLFDKQGNIHAQARRRPRYIMEVPGQVEQDPMEIWEMSKEVIEEVINSNNLKASDINSIAICTQRASFLFWDKDTGELYSNIITWQDKRAAAFAIKMTNKLSIRLLRAIGKILRVFGSTKMLVTSQLRFSSDFASIRTAYFLENNPNLKVKVKDPNTSIIWGQIDSWILWNLTGRKIHATDFSNASATGMLDPFTVKWSFLLKIFGIHPHYLPEIKETKDDYGYTSLFGEGNIPIKCVIADQQSSLFGQGCFNFGDMKVTNGTGSAVDLNTGNTPFASKRRLYPLIAWKIDGELTYMLEGLSHNSGNIIDWIQNELELFKNPSETEEMALSVESTEGVYFLPTFSSGISYPYFDSTARGNLFGVNLTTKKEHIVRAVLEGICFRIKDFVDGIIKDTKIKVEKIKADGGVSQNKFILQFLSDILGKKIEHSQNPETTALGAAFIAGLETGFWSSQEDLMNIIKTDKTYTPIMSAETRTRKYEYWKDIINRSLNYENL